MRLFFIFTFTISSRKKFRIASTTMNLALRVLKNLTPETNTVPHIDIQIRIFLLTFYDQP